jgi:hypothetical protein
MILVSATDTSVHFCGALGKARRFERPYLHLLAEDLLPAQVVADLADLPIAPARLDGCSGKRELHNEARTYCDVANQQRFPVMRQLAEALQAGSVAAAVAAICGAVLEGAFLRLEYAVDTDGFWLEPHTDLGVKKFTGLIALSGGEAEDLGTDLYSSPSEPFGRAPFEPNAGTLFVPGTTTWHGFARRPITGLRKSLIVNYVGPDWQSREQLAFPDRPVRL